MKSFKEYITECQKTLVVTFGDFNPPSSAHQETLDMVAEMAGGGADYSIYSSQTQDAQANPLKYRDKVKFMRKMFPTHARNILLDESVTEVLRIADQAYEKGYTELVYVTESSAVAATTALLTKHNGEMREDGHYHFSDGIRVVSSGDTTNLSEEANRSGVTSATLREAAAANDFEAFASNLPKNFGEVQELMNATRKGMGLKETYGHRKHTSLPKVSDVREDYTQGKIFNVGDIVTKGNSELVVTERCPNFVVCEDIEGAEQKCWLDDIHPRSIEEGVGDPAIFKAVFMAGGPGSGKSYTLGRVGLPSLGFKVLSSDVHFERAMKKAAKSGKLFPGVGEEDVLGDPDILSSKSGQRVRKWIAKPRTTMQEGLWIDGRLGVVIDGTGKSFSRIKKQAERLKKFGYDVSMLFVNTNLETALARNEKRERTLKKEVVEQGWNDVQNNLGGFQQFFGDKFVIVDNSDDAGAKFQKATTSAFKKFKTFSESKPTSPIARQWISDMAGADKKLLRKFGITEDGLGDQAEYLGEESAPTKISPEDLVKFFDSLKSKDKVEVWYDSSVRKATMWLPLVVGRKSKSAKYDLEKITLRRPDGAGVKFFLYKRNKKDIYGEKIGESVTLAVGDMGTSLISIRKV